MSIADARPRGAAPQDRNRLTTPATRVTDRAVVRLWSSVGPWVAEDTRRGNGAISGPNGESWAFLPFPKPRGTRWIRKRSPERRACSPDHVRHLDPGAPALRPHPERQPATAATSRAPAPTIRSSSARRSSCF